MAIIKHFTQKVNNKRFTLAVCQEFANYTFITYYQMPSYTDFIDFVVTAEIIADMAQMKTISNSVIISVIKLIIIPIITPMANCTLTICH